MEKKGRTNKPKRKIEGFEPMVLKDKDAEKFLKDIKKPPTKKEKVILKRAEEVYASIKPHQEKNIKAKKSKEKVVTEENFDPQKDHLWTPTKGNSICHRCWKEKPTSQVKMDNELPYPVCDECQVKRKEISKKAEEYWKGKQPTIRRE